MRKNRKPGRKKPKDDEKVRVSNNEDGRQFNVDPLVTVEREDEQGKIIHFNYID